MKNNVLLVTFLSAASIASIAIATTISGGSSITTRNAENGGFTISQGGSVNISGCNGSTGSSNCVSGTAAGGDVAKKICEIANNVNLGPTEGDTPINLATPCGQNPEGAVSLKDCCKYQTVTGVGQSGWAPKPNAPGTPNDNKCILSPDEIKKLQKQGKNCLGVKKTTVGGEEGFFLEI